MKGTRKTADAKPEHERIVSGLPNEWPDDPPRRGLRRPLAPGDYLADLAGFQLPKDEKERRNVTVPQYLWRLLDCASRLTEPRSSRDSVCACCLKLGVVELQARFSEIKTIGKVREHVQGDDRVSAFYDDWSYSLDAHHTSPQRRSVRVRGGDYAIVSKAAEDIGIDIGVLVCLAWMLVLISFPLPAEPSGWMVKELKRFRRELRDRADLAQSIAPAARRSPERAWSWDDVCAEDD